MWKERVKGWLHDDKNIKGFFGEYKYLSNFHEAPAMFEGVLYPASENAFMAAKTTDLEERKEFLNLLPYKAKKLGRSIELREDWQDIKFDVMYTVVKDKFSRNEDLKKLLLSTGEKYLEETNWWNDKIWGVCNGQGENNLGKILMRVREELK